MERIPHKEAEEDSENIRRIMASTLGDRIESLRGVDKKAEKKKRGKKVPAGRDYTLPMEESEEEESDSEELPDLDAHLEEEEEEAEADDDEDGDEVDPMEGSSRQPLYRVGSYVVALYEKIWYIAQVEGEEPEEESAGFTLLKYMNRVGPNQFTWGQRIDRLKTLNNDIIMHVEGGPVPVSSRCMGLDKRAAQGPVVYYS
jgi:hypothetical protein